MLCELNQLIHVVLLCVLMCMCVCACVHFYVGAHECEHMNVRGLLQGAQKLSSLFFRQGFSLNRELGDLARLAGQ